MKLLQDKYSMNDTVHLTAVPGISVAKGGERELASAEVQESDTVRDVGPFYLRGGQAVFRFDGGDGKGNLHWLAGEGMVHCYPDVLQYVYNYLPRLFSNKA